MQGQVTWLNFIDIPRQDFETVQALLEKIVLVTEKTMVLKTELDRLVQPKN